MELADFRSDFLNRVAIRAETDRNFKHIAFIEEAEEILAEAGEVSNLEVAFYRRDAIGAQGSLAVDAYSFDDVDDSLRVFVAAPGFEPTIASLDRSTTDNHLKRVTRFVAEAAGGRLLREMELSEPAYALAQDIKDKWSEVSRVRAYLLTDGQLNTRNRDWPEGTISGVPVEYHIWDIDRLFRVHTSRSGREDLVIDLTPWGGGLPCVATSHVSDDYQAFLCVVPGGALASLYEEYGSRLLEGNVRSFLAVRGSINKGIRNTILHGKDMFFAYNNGIAATALSAETSLGVDGIVRLVSITDLQIVNGGQTTASLANARRQDRANLDGIFVPMKLSIVSPEKAAEMIPNIARYANTQNRVNEADFFSNHEYHRRLEGFSRRLLVPPRPGAQHETRWYYERSRGQYTNETFKSTAVERRRFEETYPKSQVFSKTDLAKSEMAWRQMPHVVSLGAQKNFLKFADVIGTEWTAHEEHFHEEYFRTVVARVVLFRALEKLVSLQPWYSGGYRANVVYYTMAKLAQMIEKDAAGRYLDTGSIWRTQTLTPALEEQLKLIARRMHEVITDPPAGVKNVTEWAKREACWKAAAQQRVALSEPFIAELVSAGQVRDAQKAAMRQERMDEGIVAQSAVFALGPEYWGWVRDWARSRNYLSARDEGILREAVGMPNRIPTEHQCRALLELKHKFELEGMEPRAVPE